jgi:hypothetical protein
MCTSMIDDTYKNKIVNIDVQIIPYPYDYEM